MLTGRIGLMWPAYWASPRSASLAELALCGMCDRPIRLVQGVLTQQKSAFSGSFSGPAGLGQEVFTWQNQIFMAPVLVIL